MTEANNESVVVHVGDDEISLMDIAGIEMNEIEEYRLVVTPAGKFMWRILEAKLEARDVTNKEDPNGAKIKKVAITFELESQNCFALIDEKLNPASYLGIKHYESFWINDAAKDIGRVKAFLVDVGIQAVGSLTDLLAQAQGVEFISDVTNVPDKNNPDFIYANLKKPMTVAAFQEANPSNTVAA